MQIVIGDSCYFDFIDKETGEEKTGKRTPAAMFLILPAITNTGNYKISWWIPGKNSTKPTKYTIHAIKHKPGWIHDRRNPNPGKSWFIADSDYSKTESIADNSAMLKWLTQHMGSENAGKMLSIMTTAEPKTLEKQGKSISKPLTIAHKTLATINRPVCNWSSSTELLKV